MRTTGIALLLVLAAVSGCDESGAVQPAPGAGGGSQPGGVTQPGGTTGPAAGGGGAEPPGTGPTGPDDGTTLGPTGGSGVRLGMSAAEAGALGIFSPPAALSNERCQTLDAIRPAAVGRVSISRRLGVAIIDPPLGKPVHTPEGMTIGWSKTQVARTYRLDPASVPEQTEFPVPGNPAANYRVHFSGEGVLTRFDLELADQDCAS